MEHAGGPSLASSDEAECGDNAFIWGNHALSVHEKGLRGV